jgi:hypothetical protein
MLIEISIEFYRSKLRARKRSLIKKQKHYVLIIFMLITRRKVGLITSLMDEGAVPLVSGTKI